MNYNSKVYKKPDAAVPSSSWPGSGQALKMIMFSFIAQYHTVSYSFIQFHPSFIQQQSLDNHPVSVIQVQTPAEFSFHRVMLLSPPDTASMLPIVDQLTCQTTSLNSCSTFGIQTFLPVS